MLLTISWNTIDLYMFTGLRRRTYSLETSPQHLQAVALPSTRQAVEIERPKNKNHRQTEVTKQRNHFDQKEKNISSLHYLKVNWLETILDNNEYERTIVQEIANKAQFVPDMPSKHRLKLDPSVCIGVDTPEGRRDPWTESH